MSAANDHEAMMAVEQAEAVVPPATKRALLDRTALPWWSLLIPVLGLIAILMDLAKAGGTGAVLAAVVMIVD